MDNCELVHTIENINGIWKIRIGDNEVEIAFGNYVDDRVMTSIQISDWNEVQSDRSFAQSTIKVPPPE